MTVPASPQSTWAGPVSRPGSTVQLSPLVVMPVPMDRSPAIINLVSRAFNPPAIVLGPSASAPRISARFVWDLLPGTATRACTGPWATGAGHGSSCSGTRGSLPDCAGGTVAV